MSVASSSLSRPSSQMIIVIVDVSHCRCSAEQRTSDDASSF